MKQDSSNTMFQLKAPSSIFENNMKSFLEQIKSYCQSGTCIISENPSLHTYVSHKALMGPILSDTISQNSTECLLVMFHTGLLHVQKLTNIYIYTYIYMNVKRAF